MVLKLAKENMILNSVVMEKFLFVSSANGTNANGIFKYNLTSPYDVSSCEFGEQNKNLGSTADPNLQNGSNAGDMVGAIQKNRPQGLEINDDGTKIFVIYHGDRNFGGTAINTRLLELIFQPLIV